MTEKINLKREILFDIVKEYVKNKYSLMITHIAITDGEIALHYDPNIQTGNHGACITCKSPPSYCGNCSYQNCDWKGRHSNHSEDLKNLEAESNKRRKENAEKAKFKKLSITQKIRYLFFKRR
jgi:hypothetical protein